MKEIKSIQIWDKGVTKLGQILTLKIVDGEPFKHTTFLYQILSAEKSVLTQGNITLDGDDYQGWGDDDNYIFDWAAEKLSLTIIGDWVPPTTTTTTTEEPISTTSTTTTIVE